MAPETVLGLFSEYWMQILLIVVFAMLVSAFSVYGMIRGGVAVISDARDKVLAIAAPIVFSFFVFLVVFGGLVWETSRA